MKPLANNFNRQARSGADRGSVPAGTGFKFSVRRPVVGVCGRDASRSFRSHEPIKARPSPLP